MTDSRALSLVNTLLLCGCRMWHQIADNLIELSKHAAFDMSTNQDLLDLYRPMIQPLHDKMNPLKYAIVTVHVSR